MLENEIGVIQQQLKLPVTTRYKRKVPGCGKLQHPKNCGEWEHEKDTWKKQRQIT